MQLPRLVTQLHVLRKVCELLIVKREGFRSRTQDVNAGCHFFYRISVSLSFYTRHRFCNFTN